MTIFNRRESIIFFIGDSLACLLALWTAIFVRSWTLPSLEILGSFILPFSILFIVWAIVFFIAGLYEKQTTLFRNKLPSVIINAQISNIVISFLFFYFVPVFGITPKTTLFIYLIISSALIILWRLYGSFLFLSTKKSKAILIGAGTEVKEIYDEVNKSNRYSLEFVSFVDLSKENNFDFERDVVKRVEDDEVTVLVVDMHHKRLESVASLFYKLIFSKVIFIDISKVYEDVFDREPLSLLQEGWFIENISTTPKLVYSSLKRIMDIVVSVVIGIISLIFYPFVWIAIKCDDGGPIFIAQNRVGKDNKLIRIIKIRSMSVKNNVDLTNDSKQRITRVGNFLRKSRIDELPQIWSVIRGEQSLIGPRPELPELVSRYEQEISYYSVRHLIKPGLSGWAQIYHDNHPHHGVDVEQTKEKLSYDLYYIKNRSFMLDVKIALRTIAQLILRKGK